MTSADVDARRVPAGPLAAPAPPGLGVCTGPASRRTVSTLRASSHAPNVSAITCGCACTHARTLTRAHSHAHTHTIHAQNSAHVCIIYTCTKPHSTHTCAHACPHACSHARSVSGGAEQRQAQPPGSGPGAVTPSAWQAGGARGHHALRVLLPDREQACSLYPSTLSTHKKPAHQGLGPGSSRAVLGAPPACHLHPGPVSSASSQL